MTDQRKPRGSASKARPQPSAWVKCTVHQRDGYAEIVVQTATADAQTWVECGGIHFGEFKVLDHKTGLLLLVVNPLYDADRVAEYLESYAETEEGA